jgi:hypothetical protein
MKKTKPHPADVFHHETPQYEIKNEGTMKENAVRINSLDMERVEQYTMFMPRASDNVINDLDLGDSYQSIKSNNINSHRGASRDSYSSYPDNEDYDSSDNDDDYTQRRDKQIDRVNPSGNQGNLSARDQGYTPSSPKRVVRISPRSKKTFNNWQKYEDMYKEDRKNNVNPLFMSSMCEYDDPWTRECKQKKKAKQNYVGEKEWTVTPHHAAVAKRDYRAAQTSVTARGPYIPPHEAHRRYFFDRRKWLEGPWHIPAPSGSFTNRGTTFAAGSAVEKGSIKNSMRGNTSGKRKQNRKNSTLKKNRWSQNTGTGQLRGGSRSPRVRR